MAKEDFLQFIWKHEIFCRRKIRTTCGKILEILRPGEQNFHSGPDFFNARIRVDQLVWAGNVEIHLNASDWFKHGHHEDPAYDNVILHVVRNFDCEIWNSYGRRILSTILEFPGHLGSRYESLRANDSWLPCNQHIRKISSLLMQHWFTRLHSERLSQKSDRISRILTQQRLGREEALYRAMGSGYGLPINSLPFEMMTSGIPLQLLIELRDNLFDMEAILFGQSGFLHFGSVRGPYANNLLGRYREKVRFIPGKPVPQYLWKFLRLRPASFPTLRISQFASLIHHRFPMTDALLSFSSITELEQLLRVQASQYWDTHYVFGKCSPPLVKHLGRQSILTLIINVIVPFLNALGKTEQRKSAGDRAVEILSELEAESNHIIEKWSKFGIKPQNAFESQALIQLHNAYCKQKRCLDCQIGAVIIESAIHEEQ